MARIEAVVRRRRRGRANADVGPLVAGELEIRGDQFQAFVSGQSVGLTRREFELLQVLADARGKVIEREEIYQRVWGYAMAHGDRSVDVFVRKLRRKLEKQSAGWEYIHTHFGVGYRFEPEVLGGESAEVEPAAAEATAPAEDASSRRRPRDRGLERLLSALHAQDTRPFIGRSSLDRVDDGAVKNALTRLGGRASVIDPARSAGGRSPRRTSGSGRGPEGSRTPAAPPTRGGRIAAGAAPASTRTVAPRDPAPPPFTGCSQQVHADVTQSRPAPVSVVNRGEPVRHQPDRLRASPTRHHHPIKGAVRDFTQVDARRGRRRPADAWARRVRRR